jgi:hypothetical protein
LPKRRSDRRRFVEVTRADRRHHGEPGHRVERRADDAAVQALVRVVADQLGPHREVAGHALAGERVDAQAEDRVERDPLLEQLRQPGDELGLERRRRDFAMRAHSPSWRAASSFMISSLPPPIIITLTSR